MSYTWPFLARWTRRDWLAILVVTATVIFLTGTTLLGVAVAGQTTSIAAEYSAGGTVTHYDGNTPPNQLSAGGVVLSMSRVWIDEQRAVVVGVPPDVTSLTLAGQRVDIPDTTAGVLISASAEPAASKRVVGPAEQRILRINRRTRIDLFPAGWYVTTPDTVKSLGPTGGFILHPDKGVTPPSRTTVPLVGALQFFLFSTTQLAHLLRLTTIASAALVLVTVYSVTSITVADRATAIRVVRSTGASRHRVRSLFAGRAGLLTLVGVALGYAGGLIIARSLINGAVFLGVTTSLNVQPTGRAAWLLGTSLFGLALTGTVAGWIAAHRSVRGSPIDPGTLPTQSSARSDWVLPTVLGWDALIPSVTTLTVFVAFALLVTAMGATITPITATSQGTITEPQATHPIASTVPQAYAPTLRSQGATVSPEILLFLARGNEPIIARGVNFSAYAELTGIRVIEGDMPADRSEALLGRDLATALNVDVGETITVGGSTRPAVTRVEIVGIHTGDGPEDDQLLLSLGTAQHLSGKAAGTVQFLRVDGVAGGTPEQDATTILITELTATRRANGTVRISVTATNVGLSAATRTATVSLGNRTQSLTLRAPSGQTTTGTVTFRDVPPGRYDIQAGTITKSSSLTTTGSGAGISITGLPSMLPSNSWPMVRVTRGTTPVSNATVTVNNTRYRTDDNGTVRIPFGTPGEYTLLATYENESASQTVRVSPGTQRTLGSAVTIRPTAPTLFTHPVVTVRVWNPWNRTITTNVTVMSQGMTDRTKVSVPAGQSGRVRTQLLRRPAGEYIVTVRVGAAIAETTYRVTGDERLAAALASSGRRTQGSGISQAVELVVGNLQVLLVTLTGMAGVMVIGGTTAALARSIAATRREIGIRRAVGARPRDIYRLILADALRVGGIASLSATVLGAATIMGLLALGELRLFGISLRPELSPVLLGSIMAAGITLTLVSAGLAALPLVYRSPAALLRDRTQHDTREVSDA